jgi:hypothetical protein
LFSSAAAVHPLISGMLGLDGDALAGTFTMAPHIPLEWKQVRFENYRVGSSIVSGEIANEPNATRVHVEVRGPALDVTIAPAFPADTKLLGLRGNGLKPQAQSAGPDLHLPVLIEKAQSIDVTYQIQTGAATLLNLAPPEPGDHAPGAK